MLIMDGDLYLIKQIKSRPVLWNNSLNASKWEIESAWSEISAKIGTESDWIKSRWNNLQERFFLALRVKRAQPRIKFKYFTEMLFVTRSVGSASKKRDNIDGTPEFIITTKELEESNEYADNIIAFEEIVTEKEINKSDDAPDEATAEIFEECHSTEPEKDHSEEQKYEPAVVFNIKSELSDEPPPKVQKLTSIKEEMVNLKNIEGEISTTGDVCVIKSEPRKQVETAQATDNNRSEDVIFGELVTAMLKTIPDAKKKQVKKEIMNILLS